MNNNNLNLHYQSVQTNPNSFEAHHRLGQALQNQGQFQEATNAYLKAIRINPNFAKSHHNLGQCLARQGKFKEAITAYQKAINLAPKVSENYHSLGDARFEHKQWSQAVNAYQKAIDINPNFAWSHYNLGRALANQDRTEEAIQAYEKAIEFNPQFTECYETLGNSFLQNKLWNKAAEYYKKSADIWFDRQNWTKATEFYNKVIELDENMAEAHYQIGRILQQQGHINDAVSSYLKAIQAQPNYSQPYLILRNTPLQLTKLDEAISTYYKAIEKNPDFPPLHINLADALTKSGNIKEAVERYKIAIFKQTKIKYPELVQEISNSGDVKKPDFIIIGTEKSGTSSLYVYLVQHPQIIAPIEKEIHFFSHKFDYGNEWYLAHFPPILNHPNFLTGEASTSYFHTCHLDTHKRLFSLLPNTKLILLLRNPVERTISHYHQRVRLGFEHRSLEKVISSEMEILKGAENPISLGEKYWKTQCGYLWVGLYFHFLKDWMSIFPKEQILILKSGDFNENPKATMAKVYNLLGLPDHQLSHYEKYNAGSYPPISEKVKRELFDFFAPHNSSLEEYLGVKFNW
ncbi:MAG: tetratricopeptide repeat protein [Cyanobacteria bacterium P01_H01_bin.35]